MMSFPNFLLAESPNYVNMTIIRYLLNMRHTSFHQSVEAKLDTAYLLWDKRYRQLLAKVNDNPATPPGDVLNSDEVKLLKIFGRVDWYYRRLSGTLGRAPF